MRDKRGLFVLGIVFGVIAIILVLMGVGSYNKFVSLEQKVDSQWSQVENQYQRQADIIPNLVSTVSSQVNSETKFVKDVIAARTAYVSASTQVQKDAAGQQLNSGIQNFVNAVAEDYPKLLASEAYTALRDELIGAQNRITTERGRYIEAIQSYNVAVKRVPGKLFASLFGFEEKEYYHANENAMTTPSLGNASLP